jgi:type I restriction enzyme M protein
MASRPIYMPESAAPYRTLYSAEFTWNSGLSASQKKKNVTALHESFAAHFPGKKVLEISSKSMQEGGVELSAFNLMKFVPSLGKSLPVEVIYHAGKVFRNGGPYTDLLEGTSREAKKDERLKNSGAIVGFRFEGRDFPIRPQTFFYDYLYVNALLENEDLAKIVLQYDGFTDIEFNPEKSVNCQAKSAALFVSLMSLLRLVLIVSGNRGRRD